MNHAVLFEGLRPRTVKPSNRQTSNRQTVKPFPMKIIVACGGTGGHAFPGLAVAEVLRARGHDVTVWESGRDVESSVMRSWDGKGFSTHAQQLSLRNAPAIIASIFRCRREIRRSRPDVLLAMGSYSSLPPVLAARAYGIPVVLHEANTVPGRAMDFLAK